MVLDINMPEVSGLDMLEFLRRRKEWKDLPIIMLSSEAADVMVDKALQLGADGYVMKPVTIEELEKIPYFITNKDLFEVFQFIMEDNFYAEIKKEEQ